MFTLGDTWELSSDDGVDSWFAKLQKITSDRGFDKVLFGLAQRNHQDPGAVLIVDNYPVQWRADYDSAKYTTIDPVVAHSAQHCTPLVWADSMYKNSVQQAFREEAYSYGLIHGVSIPMHGPRGEFGVFSLSLDAETPASARSHIAQEMSNLVFIKDIVLQSATTFAFDSATPNIPSLTSQEKDILRWCYNGKTSWEISIIFGCSEANINFHIGKITRKLGVSSRRAAVLLAINAGLILS
ncbi:MULTISPECIES: helix-turn-helix transcriptional regulator [Pseudomonas]|uniref:Transcriptional activator protein LasR n=1 Tax=Pseudomonas fluorescens TaxID=294 RepID=A0A109KY10_PSEFL|nr:MULTISPECIES: LuxR family transcriptional regulator [Pseudomonas]KWV77500.1 Transcriptional activator protein LasR [Pseudomonas fluorescens]